MKQEIERVLIIGAGTMGQQIAVPCMTHGFHVVLHDTDASMLEKAVSSIDKIIRHQVECGNITDDEGSAVMNRLSTSVSPEEAARGIDIISESVPEDPDLKGKVFARFNELCDEHTIFTTNTSMLLPSMFAEKAGRPDRLIALHFHDTRFTSIVDVMPHPGTSQETVQRTVDFARNMGQIPIVLKKENSGYVFNAMLSALFQAAQGLASNEVATVRDIDRAWMGVTRMMVGPFGIMDSIGIDTVHKIVDYWGKKTNDPQLLRNAEFLKAYIDRGELGAKSGRGFYDYPNPEFLNRDFIENIGSIDDTPPGEPEGN